jgi:DNA-binding transcriptional regulator YdaS (Cro superfamily)
MLSSEDVRKRLATACQTAGSESAWAKAHGLSQSYVNKVVNGRKPPSDTILKALGLRSGYEEAAE